MPRLLLVEDNEMNRDMLSRRLLRKGYELEMAVDGHEALAKTLSFHPDLILMDVSLPNGLDGWEVTRRLKADAPTRAIPIIALTAHALSTDREKSMEAGCDEFETKPVDFVSLTRKIDALLATHGGRATE
ncbi:MAG: response regulator [Bryobacteraceae bacterium]|nr:response regulator [Bryobacteraceae bacterium]